jgi:hypothetical protein
MRPFLFLLVMVSLTGCETLKIASTSKIQPQAAPTDVGNLEIVIDASASPPHWGSVPQGITDACTPNIAPLAASIWVPLVAKLVFDVVANKASDYIKKVQSDSSKSMAFKTVVDSNTLSSALCFVAYRRPLDGQKPNTNPEPNAVVVMRVQQLTNAIRLVPIYAAAKNSISLTKCTSDCNAEHPKGKINIALAITAMAPIKTPLSDVHMREFGTIALTVKGVPLNGSTYTAQQGTPATATANPIGNPSGILGIPAVNAPMQLSVGMTELGDVAGDPDVALGEIQAAHATLSEGALAEIKAHYEREAAK